MAASYPASLKSFTSKVDNVDDYMAADINSAYDEIVAIETELGANSAFVRTAYDGTLLNGKFVPSVASNNLSVALKGANGSDPSSTNPVRVKINGTWRTVTAALSVTVNAGTSTFAAGGTEVAAKEIDYFVYLAWRAASSAVVLGFARIPYAAVYSDFSGTATNEKYAAFSTAPAAADDVVVIGRFPASNSGTASYNWSVPTFTSANLIQQPIFETRKLSYTPTVTATTGTPTTVTKACYYKVKGDELEVYVDVTVVNKGTSTGNIKLTTPLTYVGNFAAAGKETAVSGVVAGASIVTSIIYLSKYDATTLWVDTYQVSVTVKGALV